MKSINPCLQHPAPRLAVLSLAFTFGFFADLGSRTSSPGETDPKILETFIHSNELGPLAFGMRVTVPLGKMAWIQTSNDLNAWTDFGAPTLAVTEEMELLVPMDDEANRMFFRVRTAPCRCAWRETPMGSC